MLSMVITGDYSGFMLFFFASGKCAKIPLSSYATKQNRRKLLKAYSDKEPLAMMLYQPEETELPASAPVPAGCCWWVRRRSPPRPPATVRAWRWSP